MSSHIFSDEQLIAFALGELDDAESERVASHIAECAQCRGTVASFQDIRASVREDDSIAVPPATLAHAQAILRQHASTSQPGWFELIRRGPLQRARQLAGVSALASLLLTLALLYGSARLVSPAVQATLPGDPLYPVKTTIEDVRIATALDDSTRVRAQLSIAQARVTEISALVAQGRYDSLPKTTQDYEQHVQQATATLGEVLKQNPGQVALAQKAEQDLARYEVSLAAVQENSPGDVKPQIHQAVIASTAAKSTVQNQLSNISQPSNATPAPLVTPTLNVVATASSAPALPAATKTLAPAPTIVTPLPSAVTTVSPAIGTPTTASASPSKPPSVSPVATLPASATVTTTIPATSTVFSTGTPVAATGTPTVTITSAPTSTPGPTETAPTVAPSPTITQPAATTTATITLSASTPTPGASTPTPVPAIVSQTATPALPSPTPAAASVTPTPPAGPTGTPSAPPTSTSPVATSGGSPSFTSTAMPNPTSIPPGPSATTPPAATAPATVGTTPFAATPSASSVPTPAAPTTIAASATSSPSAGSGSAEGTKPLPATPGSTTSSTAPATTPATGSGASATSVPLAGTPSTNGGPTTTTGSPGKTNAPTAPAGTVGSPVGATPAATSPINAATPTTGLVIDLVDATGTRASRSAVRTDRPLKDDPQMMCDVPRQSKSSLPPIIFGTPALLASLGIIIPTR